ncbi:hypothetical protein [Streptosporangium sp. NPDC051022]
MPRPPLLPSDTASPAHDTSGSRPGFTATPHTARERHGDVEGMRVIPDGG